MLFLCLSVCFDCTVFDGFFKDKDIFLTSVRILPIIPIYNLYQNYVAELRVIASKFRGALFISGQKLDH